MNILLLGPLRPELQAFLASFGDRVAVTEEPIAADSPELSETDFIVSYGYRHILKKELLDRFPRRAVNLHISLLPFNRGADPNLWSFLEDTPKGVSIHFLDPGVDTGDLLAQREVLFEPGHTLRTSYRMLSGTIEELFRQVWPALRAGTAHAVSQPPGGSVHRVKDRAAVEHLLTSGWDTPVELLAGRFKKNNGDGP